MASPRDYKNTIVPNWCPGCGDYGIQNAISAVCAKKGWANEEITLISGIGCSSRASGYLDFNTANTLHGRALPIASGLKMANPKLKVIVPSGDGDAAAIGGNHLIHAARRNIDLTLIVYNNSIYGMTGGQMAPTTLLGQKTATTPYGRRADLNGYPLKMGDLMAGLDGTCYITRQSVHTPAAVRRAKKAIRQAFENSMAGKGTSIVEIVATCNSGWKMTPDKSNKWMEEHMHAKYPLGDIKNTVKP